jgi:hypothetical protein
MRSAIQGPGTATVITSFCQRPTGGNIIVGARIASGTCESFHLRSLHSKKVRASRIVRGALFEMRSFEALLKMRARVLR